MLRSSFGQQPAYSQRTARVKQRFQQLEICVRLFASMARPWEVHPVSSKSYERNSMRNDFHLPYPDLLGVWQRKTQ